MPRRDRSDRHPGRRARPLLAALALLVPSGLLPACRATPDHSALDAAAARGFVREQALALHDLSAAVSLSIETADFDGSLSGALLVEPPARLRLRATKLMQDVFDLVVTPDELDLFWFRDRTFYRRRLAPAGGAAPTGGSSEAAGGHDAAPASPRGFLARLDGRAMRLSLANFELPAVGDAGELPTADLVASESFGREGGDFVVRAQLAGGERLERRFDGRSLFLESVTLHGADGAPKLRATYDDFEQIGDAWIPTSMVLDDLTLGARFEMNFDDVALNEGVLPGAFVLAPPPGVAVTDL